jgi:hypothetical protein
LGRDNSTASEVADEMEHLLNSPSVLAIVIATR